MRVFLLVAPVVLSAVATAGAQVPLSECLGCPWPPGGPNGACTSLPAGCFCRAQGCSRQDIGPYLTNQGTPGTVFGGSFGCENCAGCPECPPPPMTCLQTLQVCFNETVSVNIAGGITEKGPIEASLKGAIGISESKTVCASMQCGTGSLAPCKKVAYQAQMSVLNGVAYAIDHVYTRWGIIDNHIFQECDLEGVVWTQPDCDTKTSTVTGNKSLSSQCVTTLSEDC